MKTGSDRKRRKTNEKSSPLILKQTIASLLLAHAIGIRSHPFDHFDNVKIDPSPIRYVGIALPPSRKVAIQKFLLSIPTTTTFSACCG
jgi:hypothetical protein